MGLWDVISLCTFPHYIQGLAVFLENGGIVSEIILVIVAFTFVPGEEGMGRG